MLQYAYFLLTFLLALVKVTVRIIYYRFREIITGFVTQKDPLLRKQVLKRLDTLIYLQGELDTLLTLCDTKYQPPPCYFHYFPLPPFIKIEKKSTKKGKKSKKETKSTASVTVENELWEAGSTLCFKNPAYFRKFDAKVHRLNFVYEYVKCVFGFNRQDLSIC